VSLKSWTPGEPKPSGKEYRLAVGLKEGIAQDDAKKIAKIIRDEGAKGIKAQVQGEELRVSSKKKDDLQDVMALLKARTSTSPCSSSTTASPSPGSRASPGQGLGAGRSP